MIPIWMQYIGYLLLVVVPLGYAWTTWSLIRGRTHIYEFLLISLAVIYFFGASLKVTMLGPDWLRYHMGDFGFPVAIAYIYGFSHEAADDDTLDVLRRRTRILYFTLALSIGYELFCGLMINVLGLKSTFPFIGGFDPIDIVMYVLGTLSALLVIRRWRHVILVHRHDQQLRLQELRQIESAIAATQPRSAKPPLRKPRDNRSRRARKK